MQSTSARDDSRPARASGQSAAWPRNTTGCAASSTSRRNVAASMANRDCIGLSTCIARRAEPSAEGDRTTLLRRIVDRHQVLHVRQSHLSGHLGGAVVEDAVGEILQFGGELVGDLDVDLRAVAAA